VLWVQLAFTALTAEIVWPSAGYAITRSDRGQHSVAFVFGWWLVSEEAELNCDLAPGLLVQSHHAKKSLRMRFGDGHSRVALACAKGEHCALH
jgi:hypothetical protein